MSIVVLLALHDDGIQISAQSQARCNSACLRFREISRLDDRSMRTCLSCDEYRRLHEHIAGRHFIWVLCLADLQPRPDELSKVAELSFCGNCCRTTQSQQSSLGLSGAKLPGNKCAARVRLASSTQHATTGSFCMTVSDEYPHPYTDCTLMTEGTAITQTHGLHAFVSRIAKVMEVWPLLGLGDET